MKERKFKVKIKMTDDRKVEKIQHAIPGVRAYSSPISRAVAREKEKARIKKFNATHPDYKPPSSRKKQK
jgi:hypothetical protein